MSALVYLELFILNLTRQSARRSDRRLPRRTRRTGGFTIIELLVAVAIIIVLLSLLIVAVSFATKASQKSRTQSLMIEMKKGLIRFREDVGYYPPMLGPAASPIDELRRLFPSPDPSNAGAYIGAMQDWFSTCGMADYLVGWDGHDRDGYGKNAGLAGLFDWEIETPAAGIRHPLADGVWNATISGLMTGALIDRMKMGAIRGSETAPLPIDQGKILGPYLELKDDHLLAGITGYANGEPVLVYPGEPGYTDAVPKTIVDYWGTPIRYFRKPYPQGSLGQSWRSGVDIDRDGDVDGDDRVPTLSDVYVLRPWDIKAGAEVRSPHPDAAGVDFTTSELNSAEFALLSAGPDKRLDSSRTRDVQEYNKDNIVEVGP